MTKPLDTAFNITVNQIASRLFPTGYDVGPTAPDSLEALQRHVKGTGRMLVWDGASEETIFADAETNYAFRAWHDWCHIKGGFEFTLEGERQVAEMQKEHVRTLYGDGEIADRFCKLIECEVIGQAMHYQETGSFPTDQRAFALAWMGN